MQRNIRPLDGYRALRLVVNEDGAELIDVESGEVLPVKEAYVTIPSAGSDDLPEVEVILYGVELDVTAFAVRSPVVPALSRLRVCLTLWWKSLRREDSADPKDIAEAIRLSRENRHGD